MVDIARVAYVYNRVLEAQGQPGYFLDALVIEDGKRTVDVHKTFTTKEEFLSEIEEIVPVIAPPEADPDAEEDWWQSELERSE